MNLCLIIKDQHFSEFLTKSIIVQNGWVITNHFESVPSLLDWLDNNPPNFEKLIIEGSLLKNVALLPQKIIKRGIDLLLLTDTEDFDQIMSFFQNGGCAYILKDHPIEVIEQSIRFSSKEHLFLCGELRNYILSNLTQKPQNGINHAHFGLTAKEKDILFKIEDGVSYREAAAKQHISYETYRKHIQNIYKKLHVNNKIALANKLNELRD